jgi:hypothetical protein
MILSVFIIYTPFPPDGYRDLTSGEVETRRNGKGVD